MISDAQIATLEVLHRLAATPADVDKAFREAAEWAGAREARPAMLSEIMAFLIERRREAGEPVADPTPEPPCSLLARIAGNPYGFSRWNPVRSQWPFDALRSPLEVDGDDGVLLRGYIALSLRATNRWRLAPAFWSVAVSFLRIVLLGSIALLVALVSGHPLAGFTAATLVAFWFVVTSPYVTARIDRAAALIECNYALLEAVARFGPDLASVAGPEGAT